MFNFQHFMTSYVRFGKEVQRVCQLLNPKIDLQQFELDLYRIADSTAYKGKALPCFNNPTVKAIAISIRANGTYDEIPILADALEEAGCPRAVLNDVRLNFPRYKGYWVIEAICGTQLKKVTLDLVGTYDFKN